MTEVKRDLLLAVRAELLMLTGHVPGFTSTGQSLVVHDGRLPGGGCAACELLDGLDAALHPHRVVEVAGAAEWTVRMTRAIRMRTGADRPPGFPLGRRY